MISGCRDARRLSLPSDIPLASGAERAELSRKLCALLTLAQLGERHFEGPVTPEGHSLGHNRVYGGLVVAQAMAAAALTAPCDRQLASLHCRFLRPGDESHGVEYCVDADMDGRRVSHRRVVATQGGPPILTFSAMFHVGGEGLDHRNGMPVVPPPGIVREQLKARLSSDDESHALARFLKIPRLIDMLPVTPWLLDDRDPNEHPLRIWMRLSSHPIEDHHMRAAMLAYASDAALLLAPSVRHGLSTYRGEVLGASLDHALWLHGDFRGDDWLLYEVECPWAGAGRAFTRGAIFTSDGTLIASTAQEGMMQRRVGRGQTGSE